MNLLFSRFLKICSKFTVERPCRSVISIKLQSNFRTPFSKNTSGELLLASSHPFLCNMKQIQYFSFASTDIYALQSSILGPLSFLVYITILAIISGQIQNIFLTTYLSMFFIEANLPNDLILAWIK